MAKKNKTTVLVFGFNFSFSAGFQGKSGLVSGKVVLGFGFSFPLLPASKEKCFFSFGKKWF